MLITSREFETRMQQIKQEIEAAKLVVTNRKWFAYLSTSQLNITDSTTTTIEFDANYSGMDCEEGFSSYGYDTPERGIYLVILQALWQNLVANKRYDAYIYVNASPAWGLRQHSSLDALLSCQIVMLINADVGDVIYGKVWHNDGTNNPDLYGGNQSRTFMQVHLLSRRCN